MIQNFEHLICELSVLLSNAPFAEADHEIARGLDLIRHSFEMDCCGLMEVDHEGKQIQMVSAAWGEKSERLAHVMPMVNCFPWVFRRVVEEGRPMVLPSLNKLPLEANSERDFWQTTGIGALLMIPLHCGGKVTHLLGLANHTNGREFPENYPNRLRVLGKMIAEAVIHRSDREALLRKERELEKSLAEINNLKMKLEGETTPDRGEVKVQNRFPDIVGESDPLKYVLYRIEQVAPTKTTVLLTGETGTGKGLFARSIHEASNRKNKPFVNVNCAGLAPNLIESELFGREKGAFTGSTARQIGRFELAHGGTIFLDEIAELPLDLQSKLLKVIESGEFERLGSPRTIKVDARIIACTNRNILDDIDKGRFRRDLYYRLSVFPITIPPLRQRKEDIPLLVNYYIERFGNDNGKDIKNVSEETMKVLEDYPWPGNVRELMNVVERAVIMSEGPELRVPEKIDSIPSEHKSGAASKKTAGVTGKEIKGMFEMEREHILKTLQQTGWKVEGRNGAAQFLEMNPSTLRSRMRKLGIRKKPLELC